MTRRTTAIVGVAALIALAVGGFVVFRVVRLVQYMRSERSVPRPGEAGFRAANAQIHVNRGTKAFGNTPEAVELARAYSEAHKAMRESYFEGGRRGELAAAKGEFLVYCQLRQDACVFLVHVPELRQYTGEAKDALRTLSWRAAQSVLGANGASGDRELLVALRGAILFESILAGRSQGEPVVYTDGMRELRRLYPYFQPRESAAVAKASPAP